jgi:hypothetical protein
VKTKIVIIVLVVGILIAGAFLFYKKLNTPPTTSSSSVTDYKNATYTIEGVSVTLVNGYSETQIGNDPDSTSITQYFGNDAQGDLTGDGIPDVAFLITQYGGGSGTFYYLVAAIKTPNGYQGTNAIFLGDRIAPQSTEINNQEITVNYADHGPDDAMADPPTMNVSRYFRVQNGALVEIGD